MQQTEKYKLNLIESSDPFLPDGLNANTQKIEDVLAEKMEGPMVALDQRVTALEAHRVFVGSYIGTGADQIPRFVDLGFTPKAVCVGAPDVDNGYAHWSFTGAVNSSLEVTEGGFLAGKIYMGTLNDANKTYPFLALA